MKKCNIAMKEWESPLNRMKTQKVLVKIKKFPSQTVGGKLLTIGLALMNFSFLG
jgi:hypothetical protein